MEWGSGVSLHGSNLKPPMSDLGQKRTSAHVRSMSALPPKADIAAGQTNVRFVPKADIVSRFSSNHFDRRDATSGYVCDHILHFVRRVTSH